MPRAYNDAGALNLPQPGDNYEAEFIVPGRGRLVAIQPKNNFRAPPRFTPSGCVYELLFNVHYWRRSQIARGYHLPEQLIYTSILLDVFEGCTSILEWWAGSTAGFDLDLPSDHLGPANSEQGRIVRAEHARQQVPFNAPEYLDWVHVLQRGFRAILQHLGAQPPTLEAQLLHQLNFRQPMPGSIDLAVQMEDARAFVRRWERQFVKLETAVRVHGNHGVTVNASTKRHCMEEICRQLDHFLGRLANTADAVERRYMDSVYAFLEANDQTTWDQLADKVSSAWKSRLAHESRQLTARAHATSEPGHNNRTFNAVILADAINTNIPLLPPPSHTNPRSSGRGQAANQRQPAYTVTPPPGYGLHDGCVFHPAANHTNRECKSGPGTTLTDDELRAYLANHRSQAPALTNAVTSTTPPDAFAATTPPETADVNATGAQLRNRRVVEARTASIAPDARTLVTATDATTRPTTPAEVLQDGSTACCNREHCPGLEVCWWRNPRGIADIEQWRRRYTNANMYGAERAAHTQAVYDAHRAGQPIPLLAEFREQHPELRGTSTHRRPFNTRLNYVSANVEVAVEEDYACEPLTDDLVDLA